MTDLPISFSAPMVRALIAGTKTQTRRGLNLNPTGTIIDFVKVATDKRNRPVFEMRGAGGDHIYLPAGKHLQTPHFIPRYGIGDHLYVREHWRTANVLDRIPPRDLLASENETVDYTPIRYEADGKTLDFHPLSDPAFGKHRQAMHMPKWASRITLIVTDVRVQRLQDISDEDAIAEGIEKTGLWNEEVWKNYFSEEDLGRGFLCPANSYRTLWQSLHGARSWDENPWVAAYSFRVVMGNIDQIESTCGKLG